MNNQFMFSRSFSPYADNPKFIKKSVRPGSLAACAAGLALMLISLIYFMMYLLSSADKTFVSNPSEKFISDASSALEIFGIVIAAIWLFLPFIAFVSLFIRAKDKGSDTIGIGPVLISVFLIISTIFFSFIVLISTSSIGNILMSALDQSDSSDFGSYTPLYAVTELLSVFVPSVIGLIWSITGLIFCSSLRKTIKCRGIFHNGSKSFSSASFILAVINILLCASYYANFLSDGVLYSKDPSGMAGIFYFALDNNIVASVMITIFFVANTVVLFNTGRITKRYYLTADAANRSITMSGTNMYMNGNSSAAQYYQSAYTSPTPSPSEQSQPVYNNAPPIPVHSAVKTDQPAITDKTICPLCGTENFSDCKFCTNCGNKLI